MFEPEERRIVRRIKEYIKSRNFPRFYNIIMLRNGRILHFDEYRIMLISGKITPQDAYVDIRIGQVSSKADFYYPLLDWYNVFLEAYLSKLGFHYAVIIVPATGLKYVAIVTRYRDYLSIDVVNLDTVVNNLNLPKIVVEVVSKKLISGESELIWWEYEKIDKMFRSQRLFAGYDVDVALGKIGDYYVRGNQSLAKEVARIVMDYDKVFQPYTVCYDMKTWKEVDCWKIT